ncbi:MAG: sensor histidine kinase [Chloroflexota bacterium]
MSRRDFFADRLPYLVAFASVLTLTLAVIWLAGAIGQRPLSLGNLIYIGVIAIAGLIAYLLTDYQRQRPFRKQLQALRDDPSLEAFAAVATAATREQEAVQELIRTQHRLYLDELAAYRRRQEINGAFLNRWAHQMKTPVSVIDATLQEEEKAGQCPPELLASLREELDRLAEGLELMLSSARLGDFRADFVVHRIDVADAVRRAINEQRRAFIRRQVYPVLDAPAEPALADTDEKWLRFVVGQLLTNAIKYSRPRGGPAVRDDDDRKQVVVRVEAGPHAVTISVSDQGVGIPAQDIGRVFEPFFTGENGRLYPEATGMGLYLAREVCDRLGHRIEVKSEQGVGTTVTVTISTNTTLRDSR